MDINHIPATKRYLVCKSYQKILEKLFVHFKEGKISKDDLLSNISKIREVLQKTIKTIKEEEDRISKRTEDESHNFFILEYLLYNGFDKTANLFMKTRETFSDKDFFDEIKNLQSKIEQGEIKDVMQCVKENKIHSKEGFSALEQSLKILEFNKISKSNKYEGIEFAKDIFKKEKEPLRNFLMVLIDGKSNVDINSISDSFRLGMYKLYNLEDRLAELLEYGLISQKTAICDQHKNLECAGCIFNSFTRMYNRTETSEILCDGSGVILDSSNQAFADEEGRVYGKKFLSEEQVCIIKPKTCFFV